MSDTVSTSWKFYTLSKITCGNCGERVTRATWKINKKIGNFFFCNPKCAIDFIGVRGSLRRMQKEHILSKARFNNRAELKRLLEENLHSGLTISIIMD